MLHRHFRLSIIRKFKEATTNLGYHPSHVPSSNMSQTYENQYGARIAMPIMMPAIATMAIFTFIGSWNNYILPLVVLFSPEKYTLPVMMGALRGSKVAQNLGAMYLGIAISVQPLSKTWSFWGKVQQRLF